MRKMTAVITAVLALVLSLALIAAACAASIEEIEADPMFAVREGWAWPIVVVGPPSGWDSPEGEAAKYAMRMAEREISRQRGAIRGKEIVFLFSTIDNAPELTSRMRTWRGLGACSIISFAGGDIDDQLLKMCREDGPSVLFAAGEHLDLINRSTQTPYKYAFALDLHYFARANALAEAACAPDPAETSTAVISDLMSTRLARGAALTDSLIRDRRGQSVNISVPAFRQDQFVSQVYDLEAGGINTFTVWLDAMAALSIWRTAQMNRAGSKVYYAGGRQQILLDADGLMIIDQEAPLERNMIGLEEIGLKLRDSFNRVPSDPVLAAKALAMAEWVISAYSRVSSIDDATIADALSSIDGIPLLDERLSIDPSTHRPAIRKFYILRVENREFKTYGVVEVHSSEVSEAD